MTDRERKLQALWMALSIAACSFSFLLLFGPLAIAGVTGVFALWLSTGWLSEVLKKWAAARPEETP